MQAGHDAQVSCPKKFKDFVGLTMPYHEPNRRVACPAVAIIDLARKGFGFAPQITIGFKLRSRRSCDLEEHEMANPFWVASSKRIDGTQAVENALGIVEAFYSHT